jgi:hypothetical protein
MQDRIDELYRVAAGHLIRHTNDALPLYVITNNRVRHVTMRTIENDMIAACTAGRSFVEYTVNTHLYPGYGGDNVSLFTEKYYLVTESGTTWIEVACALSYMNALRIRLPGLAVTFTETTPNIGTLRVELPLDFLEQKMQPPRLR